MEERIEEGKIKGAIDAISLEKIGVIQDQMKTCICKVYGEKMGTGFFCKMPFENKLIPVLITNYHIISDEFLKNNTKIKITLNNEKKLDIININEKSKIYSSKKDKYDIMIIKLQEEKEIYKYLELDELLFEKDSDKLYEEKSIYILHYPNGEKSSVSFGYGIQNSNEYYIKHLCNTEHCSSGSPILNLSTNKVIGIHCGAIFNKDKKNIYNIGILLKNPLNILNKNNKVTPKKEISIIKKNEIKPKKDLKMIKKKEIKPNEKNEIRMVIEIDEFDINNEIYFLDNTNGYTDDGTNIKHYHDNLKELNESNTELYINDKKYKFKKFFKPDKEGIYKIRLVFNTSIKDCSYMFYNCSFISYIDLSSFDTKDVTNMREMFAGCTSIHSLPGISKWDTKNAVDMSLMFGYCLSLKSLPDISSWDTRNVINIKCMFCDSQYLESLPDISKWDTKNVIDMSSMFCHCIALKSLPDISKWDTKNVINMSSMFERCESLQSFPDISKWDIKKVNDINRIFWGCPSLKSLPDISNWDTKNVVFMKDIFALCISLKSLPDISKWNIKNVKDKGLVLRDTNEKIIPIKFKNLFK